MEYEKRQSYRVVGAPIIKKDAMALVTGKPVYTADIAPRDCLVVKVLRSPYAAGNRVRSDLQGRAPEAFHPGRADIS